MSELSDKMILYRAKQRISQAELARRCGVTLQTSYAIEKGIQNPSRVTEVKIRLVVDSRKKAEE